MKREVAAQFLFVTVQLRPKAVIASRIGSSAGIRSQKTLVQ